MEKVATNGEDQESGVTGEDQESGVTNGEDQEKQAA